MVPPAAVPAGPASVAGAVPGCVSDWYISYGGLTSWQLAHTDLEGLPLSDLRFDRGYSDPTDFSKGYLDFNHDHQSDVFSAVPIGVGDYRWHYSSGAASDWIDMAHDSTPPDQLRFGDFNGDGYTDVFSVVPIPSSGGLLQWRASLSGTQSYPAFPGKAVDSTPLDQLRFGDFNADGKTDFFTLRDLGGGSLGWEVSYSGTTDYHEIFSATVPLSELAFGDINADGHTDVFTTLPAGGGLHDWYYYSPGASGFQSIAAARSQGVHDVLLAGNFDPLSNTPDGFGGTDFLYTTLRLDGNHQWWYFHFNHDGIAKADLQLAYDSTPSDQLRFGDFNGDGITDVFKLQQRCKTYLPLVRR